MKTHRIGVLAGDGVGPEVVGEARKLAQRAAERFSFGLEWQEFPFGANHYLAHGETLPASAFSEMADCDALLLGAVGDPRVRPGILEQGLLLAIRFHFDQYVNLRPSLGFPGVKLPVALSAGEKLDVAVVRENTEDLYMGLGGRGAGGELNASLAARRGGYGLSGRLEAKFSQPLESAFSLGVMTRPGIERITRYACRLARSRGENRVNVVSKANAVPDLYGFWDEVTAETAKREFPDLEISFHNVDAVCYLMARRPAGWGVLLCPNLFGDIVSDLMSALAGGLGLAAAGNIGDGLSMFEPVHGSAPDIAGTGKANPLAAILAVALLLGRLGEAAAAAAVEKAVRDYLGAGKNLPIELGGTALTAQVGDAAAGFLEG